MLHKELNSVTREDLYWFCLERHPQFLKDMAMFQECVYPYIERYDSSYLDHHKHLFGARYLGKSGKYRKFEPLKSRLKFKTEADEDLKLVNGALASFIAKWRVSPVVVKGASPELYEIPAEDLNTELMYSFNSEIADLTEDRHFKTDSRQTLKLSDVHEYLWIVAAWESFNGRPTDYFTWHLSPKPGGWPEFVRVKYNERNSAPEQVHAKMRKSLLKGVEIILKPSLVLTARDDLPNSIVS